MVARLLRRVPPLLMLQLSMIGLTTLLPFIDRGLPLFSYGGIFCAWWVFASGVTFLVPLVRGTWPLNSQESVELIGRGTAYLLTTVTLITVAFVMGYAGSYRSLSLADPLSFNERLSSIDAIYFSLTTLTTVGYGDIFARSQLARAVVATQLVGTIAFAILVVGVLVNIVSKKRAGN